MDAIAFIFGLCVMLIAVCLAYGVGVAVGQNRQNENIPTAEPVDDDAEDSNWWKRGRSGDDD